jgi:hypothetical protein
MKRFVKIYASIGNSGNSGDVPVVPRLFSHYPEGKVENGVSYSIATNSGIYNSALDLQIPKHLKHYFLMRLSVISIIIFILVA